MARTFGLIMQRLDRIAGERPWLASLSIGVTTLLFGLIVYRDFVFADKLLLYKDIGSDSINVFYPNYLLRSDYLRQHGVLSWSFEVGMGQNLFPFMGTLLITPIVWLNRNAIAYALVYQHMLYVFIAATCFARFLLSRRLNVIGASVGALLLSFSAYMCMGSCWFFHATELTCFTVLLLAAERAAVARKWPGLALAVLLMSCLGAFHLYLTALLL